MRKTRQPSGIEGGVALLDKPPETVRITPPKFQQATILIRGIAPLVQHKFAAKAMNLIIDKQREGSQAGKGKIRTAKDFDAVYEGARHRSTEGWDGIPAAAFRNAMISACRIVGFKMTLAKLSLFTIADGHEEDGTPLVKITKGEPRPFFAPARNSDGSTDVRCRPQWTPGWEARVTLKWDADQFSAVDVANLLSRVGMQVGVGEGRPDSRMSPGQGWGQFELVM